MDFNVFFRVTFCRSLVGVLLAAVLFSAPAFALDSADSQIFISGFNAFQKKDFSSAIERMSEVLAKYPDSPLRDMAIFWLARAYYKAGDRQHAARYMSEFFREYPNSPLKATVEDDLAESARQYGKQEQLAAGKSAAGKAAAEKAAAEKAAAEKAAAEKAAAEKAAAEKAAAEKAAAEKAAAEKAAAEKAAAEKAAAEKAAAEKAAAEKAAAEKAAAEKAAAEKAAAEKAAAEKAAAEKMAAEKMAAEKMAAEKMAAEKLAAEKLAAEKVALAVPPAVVEKKPAEEPAKRSAAHRKKERRRSSRGTVLRERAIAEYKRVVDRYPGTPAATRAAAKLRELGITYPAPVGTTSSPRPSEQAQVLTLEVGQFAGMSFTFLPAAESWEVGRRVTLPFEVMNRGNGPDGFVFDSGFPQQFHVHFAAASAPETPIAGTPSLAAGESFRGVVTLTIPKNLIDGQRITYPVKLSSRFAPEISQSRQTMLVASAPLLRAVVKGEKGLVVPGEKVAYRLALLNIGTATARKVTLRLTYPPQYEPLDLGGAKFRRDGEGVLVLDGMQVKSGESREFNLTFRLKPEAMARQELFLRCDAIDGELGTHDSFISTVAYVQGVSGVTARTSADRLVTIPGQTVTIPVVVTNTGNVTESMALRTDLPAPLTATVYQDLNRDGIRQPNEPEVTKTAPMAPKEESYLLVQVTTPASMADGTESTVGLTLEPEGDRAKQAVVTTRLRFARPLVAMTMAARGGKLIPGEIASFELTGANHGSLLARVVEMSSRFPANLELVSSDPPFAVGKDGEYLWRFAELGAGEKKSVRINFRVRTGTTVGTTIKVKNSITYEDPLGNRY